MHANTTFEEHTDTSYGTLSHSHLLRVLLSFVRGAKWNVPAEFRKLIDVDGGWDFAAVAARDPALKQLCHEGLYMEILSWKLCNYGRTSCVQPHIASAQQGANTRAENNRDHSYCCVVMRVRERARIRSCG